MIHLFDLFKCHLKLSLGNLVSIENLLDPHDQKLMRAHDMPVFIYLSLIINIDDVSFNLIIYQRFLL